MGLVANKLIPVGVVVKDISPLDSIGHNVVEDTLCIEPGLSRYEGNEDFLYKLATSPTTSPTTDIL